MASTLTAGPPGERSDDSPAGAEETVGPASSRPRWWLHGVTLLLLLVGVALLGDRSDSWTPDDGAYALQVKVLEETGNWSYPYSHADVDPELEYVPFTHGHVTADGHAYPYVKLPVWIGVLGASTSVFGDVAGLYVPSMLGVVAAAFVAARLAGRLDPRAELWAFWAIGAGPLLVHSTAMWAHTTGAALGGLCALFVLDAARGRRVSHLGLTATLALLCSVRNEGLLLTAATLTVLGGLKLLRPAPLSKRLTRAVGATWLPASGAVGAVLVSRMWTASIVSGPSVAVDSFGSSGSYLYDQTSGAVRSLIDGAGEVETGTLLAFVAVAVCAASGVLVARRGEPELGITMGVIGLILLAARAVLAAPYDLAGMFAASPLLVFAAAAIPWRQLPRPSRVVAVWMALFFGMVLATQYPEGGSRDWGGRFFFLILVPAVVGAVVAGLRLIDGMGEARVRRAVAALMIALVVVPTALGVHATLGLRDLFGDMTDRSVAPGSEVVIRMPDVLSRLGWRVLPEEDWLAADPEQVPGLLAELREHDAGSVTLSGRGASRVRVEGYRREVIRPDLVVFVPVG